MRSLVVNDHGQKYLRAPGNVSRSRILSPMKTSDPSSRAISTQTSESWWKDAGQRSQSIVHTCGLRSHFAPCTAHPSFLFHNPYPVTHIRAVASNPCVVVVYDGSSLPGRFIQFDGPGGIVSQLDAITDYTANTPGTRETPNTTQETSTNSAEVDTGGTRQTSTVSVPVLGTVIGGK